MEISMSKLASYPNLLAYSVEDNLRPTARYLTDELGISKSKLASHPQMLKYSVEANLRPKTTWIRETFPRVDAAG